MVWVKFLLVWVFAKYFVHDCLRKNFNRILVYFQPFSQKHMKICIIGRNSANLTKTWQISDKKISQTIMDKIYWPKAINCQNFQKHAFLYLPMHNFHLKMAKFQSKLAFLIHLKDYPSDFLVFI